MIEFKIVRVIQLLIMKKKCINCDQISFTGEGYPENNDNYKQVFSPQTAYQMTSILEGVIQRGTGKKIKKS